MENSLLRPIIFTTSLFTSLSIVKNVVQSECPPGWLHNFSSCYYINNETRVNFTTARSICQSNGGDLVCIHNSSENDYLNSSAGQGEYWIGNRKTWCLSSTERDAVKGLNCTAYYYWAQSEPDTNATCSVRMVPGVGFKDRQSTMEHQFICERPETPMSAIPPNMTSCTSRTSTSAGTDRTTSKLLPSSSSANATQPTTHSTASSASPENAALSAQDSNSSTIGLAVGLSIGLVALLVVIVLVVVFILYRRNRLKEQNSLQTDSTHQLQPQPQKTTEENVYQTAVSSTTQNGHAARGYTELNVSPQEPSAPTPAVSQPIYAQPMRPLHRQSQNNDLTVVDSGLYTTAHGDDDGSYHLSTNGQVNAVSSEPEYVANEVTLVDNSLYEASN